MSIAEGHAEKSPADGMRELRMMMLTTSPDQFGIRPTKEYPRVAGILMDWPIGEHTATILAMSDGNASLYTTSTFGILGGFAHESVRVAARRFVRAAEGVHDRAVATAEYPYPGRNRVRFYLLTFQGVRVIETDLNSVIDRTGEYSELFALGQAVLTELRLMIEKKP